MLVSNLAARGEVQGAASSPLLHTLAVPLSGAPGPGQPPGMLRLFAFMPSLLVVVPGTVELVPLTASQL